jgi:hypothetical protein
MMLSGSLIGRMKILRIVNRINHLVLSPGGRELGCPIYCTSHFVIARLGTSETKELAEAISWGYEIAAHLSGARNDRKGCA